MVLIVAALLLAASRFGIYQQIQKKSGALQRNQKWKSLRKRVQRVLFERWRVLLPIDKDIVGCNCTWLSGGKRCEKYMWWD